MAMRWAMLSFCLPWHEIAMAFSSKRSRHWSSDYLERPTRRFGLDSIGFLIASTSAPVLLLAMPKRADGRPWAATRWSVLGLVLMVFARVPLPCLQAAWNMEMAARLVMGHGRRLLNVVMTKW